MVKDTSNINNRSVPALKNVSFNSQNEKNQRSSMNINSIKNLPPINSKPQLSNLDTGLFHCLSLSEITKGAQSPIKQNVFQQKKTPKITKVKKSQVMEIGKDLMSKDENALMMFPSHMRNKLQKREKRVKADLVEVELTGDEIAQKKILALEKKKFGKNLTFIPPEFQNSDIERSNFMSFNDVQNMPAFKVSVDNIHKRNEGANLQRGAMIHNVQTKNDYIYHNECLKAAKFNNLQIYVSELHRIKNQSHCNQFSVKNLNDLVGRKRNGPHMEMYNRTVEDEQIEKSKVNKDDTAERHMNIKEHIFAWYKDKRTILPIEARENATWTKVDGKAYLIGGMNNNILNEVIVFDLDLQQFQDKKFKMDREVMRFNHTAIAYKRKIYIFGGEKFHATTRMRFPLDDIKVFDTEKSIFSYLSPTGEHISPRRNHACCVINKYMIVHGGMDGEDKVNSDLWVFNLELSKWNQVLLDGREVHQSHHTICGAYNTNLDSTEIFAPRDLDHMRREIDRGKIPIMKEGLYLFGGRDKKGQVTNGLYMVNTEIKKRYKFEKVDTIGHPPLPRYGHCFVYYPKKQYLIIYGGRNDTLWENYGSCSMSAVSILNLKYLCWCSVKIYNGNYPRYSMSYFQDDSVLYMLGGQHKDNFVNGNLLKLEIDDKRTPNFDIRTENELQLKMISPDELTKCKHFEIPSERLKDILVRGNFVNYDDELENIKAKKMQTRFQSLDTQEFKEHQVHLGGTKKQTSIFDDQSPTKFVPRIVRKQIEVVGSMFVKDKSKVKIKKNQESKFLKSGYEIEGVDYNFRLKNMKISDSKSFQPVPLYNSNIGSSLKKSDLPYEQPEPK